MRDSYKFLDRLIRCFMQKKNSIERNRFQQKELEEKASNASKEEQQIKEKLDLLISYTKQLKDEVSSSCRRRSIFLVWSVFLCLAFERNFNKEVSKLSDQHHGRNKHAAIMKDRSIVAWFEDFSLLNENIFKSLEFSIVCMFNSSINDHRWKLFALLPLWISVVDGPWRHLFLSRKHQSQKTKQTRPTETCPSH